MEVHTPARPRRTVRLVYARDVADLDRVADRRHPAEIDVLRPVDVLHRIGVARVRQRRRIALERQAALLELRERADEQALRQRVVEARAELEARDRRRAIAGAAARLDAA